MDRERHATFYTNLDIMQENEFHHIYAIENHPQIISNFSQLSQIPICPSSH